MCNRAGYDFLKSGLTTELVFKKTVLEIGSLNINGSARVLAERLGPASYLGVDITGGCGVDLVCAAENLPAKFAKESFDLIICSEVLEHIRDWRAVVQGIKKLLKPGGSLLLTTRSAGFPYHAFPHDFWRFEISDLEAIFSDFQQITLVKDNSAPGVFLNAKKQAGFNSCDLSGIKLFSVLTQTRVIDVLPGEIFRYRASRPLTFLRQSLEPAVRSLLKMRDDYFCDEYEIRFEPCVYCAGNDFSFMFNSRDWFSTSARLFNIVRCRACGAVSVNPGPDNPAQHYTHYRKGIKDPSLAKILSPNRPGLIKAVKSAGKILDVGCGLGGFLAEMKDAFQVYGCDVSSEACAAACQLLGENAVSNCAIEELKFPERYFVVITFWHSLEHLPDPSAALKKAAQLLKPDGVLVVESPDISSLQARFFKDAWFALDTPRHLQHFSPEFLIREMSRLGFVPCRKDRHINLWGTYVNLRQSLIRHFLRSVSVKVMAGSGAAVTPGLLRHFLSMSSGLCLLFFSAVLWALSSEDSFRIYFVRREAA